MYAFENSYKSIADTAITQSWPPDVQEERRTASLQPDLASADLTVVIEARIFVRDCILRGLSGSRQDNRIAAFATVDAWLESDPHIDDSALVLLSTGDRSAAEIKADCQKIRAAGSRAMPIVLLAEDAQASYIASALNDGVRGYIPTSVPLRVAFEALQLVRAGGMFIPASAFLANAAPAAQPAASPAAAAQPMFTGRQAAVVLALRRGTSNKIIAHELKMAESTVKVHVRNIMRKLKAKNRTHVAFLLNEMEAAHW